MLIRLGYDPIRIDLDSILDQIAIDRIGLVRLILDRSLVSKTLLNPNCIKKSLPSFLSTLCLLYIKSNLIIK